MTRLEEKLLKALKHAKDKMREIPNHDYDETDWELIKSAISDAEERLQKDSFDVVISFPTEKHMNDFVGWMCDGGGECCYMEADEIMNEGNAVRAMQYHEEDISFPKNSQKRYNGKHLDDGRRIIAHLEGDGY